MEFKIDYGNVPLKPRAAAPAGPLYASVDGRVSALANGEVVFLDLHNEKLHVMTEQVLGAMDVCRPFRTLDEHVREVQQAMPPLQKQPEAVKRVLEGLVARELIISDTAYVGRITRGDAAEAPAEFAALFIRACDRPQQLRALLASLLEYERRFGARRRYVVLDDSRDAGHLREQQRLVAEFAQQAGVEARHVGGERWNEIAALLGRESGQPAVADWLLRRMPERRVHGGGLGMNLAALLSAGRRYALLDDDFLFPLRIHPEADGRVDLVAAGGMPARFFADVDDALAAGRDPDGDPLQLHLDACGATLRTVLGRHPLLGLEREQLRGVAPSALPHLANAERIIATVNGHRGHSGAGSSGWLFLLDEKSRETFWADRERYLRHLDSPSLWYGPTRTRLQAHGNFTPFMVDAAQLVGYTNPAERGEDLLFAGLCRLVAPQALTAHLPTAVGHRQEAERARGHTLKLAFTPGINAYLADMAMGAAGEYQAADRALRMRGFAARLRDLAGASEAAVLGELREHLAHVRSSLVQRMQSVMQAVRSAPVYWQADMRQLIEAHGKALVNPGPPKLAEWPSGMDAAACAQRFRSDLSQHAEALEAWPAVWEAARERRERLWSMLG